MSENLTLEEVEHIVDRLSNYEKLKIISYIAESLCKLFPQEKAKEEQK
jgi:hypothetical protein